MTNKRKRVYEIIITALCVTLMTLCAYMGITAIQKAMTLNLSFKANPIVYCQLKIENEVVFDNKKPEIGGGVESINGNTLTFNKEKNACTIGITTFNLTITNYSDTQSAVSVSFDNANVGGNQDFIDVLTSGGYETYSVNTAGNFDIIFNKVYSLNLSNSPSVSLDIVNSSIISKEGANYVVASGDNANIQLLPASGYKTPITLNSILIGGKIFEGFTYNSTNGILTLPKTALTGNVIIQATATEKPAEITLSHNLTNLNISNTTIKIDEAFTTTLSLKSGLNTTYSSENTTAYTIPNHENMTLTLTPPNNSPITLTNEASENGYTYTTSENSITITIPANVINKLFPENSNDFGTLSLTAYAPRYVVGSYGNYGTGYLSGSYTISNLTIIEGQEFKGQSIEFNMGMWKFNVVVMQTATSGQELDGTPYTETKASKYFTYSIPASVFTEGDYQIFTDSSVYSVLFECEYDPWAASSPT